MQIGELHPLFFVQYKSTMDRWVTKQPAHHMIEGARGLAKAHSVAYGQETRIIKQTTTNEVVA